MIHDTACKVCGERDLTHMYSLGNRREFTYHRCSKCRLVNYDMRGGLDQTKYEAEWADPREERSGFRKMDQTYDFLVRLGVAPGRLLDIGCGSGRILARALGDGWDVVGIELSSKLATKTGEALGVDVHAMNFMDGEIDSLGTFDVVILAHVLEHLPDPVLAMRKIRSLLRPGGVAILEFPNIDALDLKWKRTMDALRVRRHRYPEGWRPGHCQEFSRESFDYLARMTGFSLDVWETYSKRPQRSGLYRRLGFGNKARVLVRAVEARHAPG